MIHKITYVCSTVPECIERDIVSQLTYDLPVKLMALKHVHELFPLLSDPAFKTDYIIFDVDDLYELAKVDVNIYDLVRTLSTVINCTVYRETPSAKPQKRKTKIIALVSDTTPYNVYKELLAMPEINNFSLRYGKNVNYNMIKECVVNYIEDGERPPKVVVDLLKPKKQEQKKLDTFKLTPRQKQIYDIIATRGSSNKHISKILNISESTVKLHVGAILKKYGVRNRTQLAVFSKQQTQSEVHP